MSGVLGQRFTRMYSETGGVVTSFRYSSYSCLKFRHVKYEYDCWKPSFAKAFMTFGRVNASARKMTSGCVSWTLRMSHSQKGSGLVCGLSTRKVRTPTLTQCITT